MAFFKYMRCFAYYIIYWLKRIGKQSDNKYKECNYFFIPLDSVILLLGIIPKEIIQKKENETYINVHYSHQSRNIRNNRYYHLFHVYYDTLHI